MITGVAGLAGTAGLHAGTTSTATLSAAVRLQVLRGRVFTGYRFPNTSRAVAAALIAGGLIPPGRVGTDTPADLINKLPFIRILRVGGPADSVNDYATTSIEVFALTSTAGENLAEQVRQYLITSPPPPAGGLVIDRVVCQSGPQERPWAETRIRRYGGTYTVVARRQRTS